MKPIYFSIVPMLFIAMLSIPSGSQAFRCGDEIISCGDSAGKVLARCGSPEYTTKDPAKIKGGFSSGSVHRSKTSQSGSNYYTKGRSYTSGYYAEEETKVEHWFYNCGDNDFVYDLTFENDVLISEDSSTRGYGPSQCLSVAERRRKEQRKQEEAIRQEQTRQQEFARQREAARQQFQMQGGSYYPYPMGPNIQNIPPIGQVQPEKKPVEDRNTIETRTVYYCKDRDGNVTLSNVGCPE